MTDLETWFADYNDRKFLYRRKDNDVTTMENVIIDTLIELPNKDVMLRLEKVSDNKIVYEMLSEIYLEEAE